jgi:hypothetical protein
MGTLVEHNPPQKKIYKLDYTRHRVYLAGSTNCNDWQRTFIERMSDLDVDVFNPRSKNVDGLFGWELDHLNIATVIALYFDPEDPSPAGLLTLGMFAKTDRLIVCCPETFHKKTDVDIICKREDIHTVETLDLLIENTIARISSQRKYGKDIYSNIN